MTFIDSAGLQDSSLDAIDTFNGFISKLIFKKARSVRFLFVVTYDQLRDSRGMNFASQCQVLENMLKFSDPETVAAAIQPLINKCDPRKRDINVDNLRSDMR